MAILEMSSFTEARERLLSLVKPVGTEEAPLEECTGRILAQEIRAEEDVPAFDRSPYDGYAFRAEDSKGASKDHPVTLAILEELPAGKVPSVQVRPGTAVKILTGAPIPPGANAVVMYEKTRFNETEVTLFSEAHPGDNIVRTGEDIQKGILLAPAGTVIDPGLMGTLAAQGIYLASVYRKPVVGIIATGDELVDASQEPSLAANGKIRNTNRYTLAAAVQKDGGRPIYLGTARDDVAAIAQLIVQGLAICDAILLSGGVSAGDYDLTPAGMEQAGCFLQVKGVDLKPGMACCYGNYGEKLVCALSGNPSSSLTNYYTVVRPAFRRLAGYAAYLPEEITVTLANAFAKKSKGTRILKGRLAIEDGKAMMYIPEGQGNVMIASTVGCDLMAVVPAGSGPLEAGAQLTAFMV